jgi:4-hydroxybenzoate polyprenyltransferase
MSDRTPLCIDCDGSLVHTDLMHEAILIALKHNPFRLLTMIVWMLRGRAYFKLRLEELAVPDAALLPYRADVIALIREAKAQGRQIVLATASPPLFGRAVADHLGLFDHVLTTTAGTNLSSSRKAAALVSLYGARGYDYLGDTKADLAVWKQARIAYVVGAGTGLLAQAQRLATEARLIPAPGTGHRAAALLRAMRPVQWVKNALVLVPVLAAHRIGDLPILADAVGGFVAFSLCASSVYLLNDMLDIEADRVHPRKRRRPFASGALPVSWGVALQPILLIAAAIVAALCSIKLLIVLVGYYALTTAYSFWLKRQVIVDVMVLAGLYTVRIIGGCAATGIAPSFWLLAFSLFLFLDLAIVKRYSELLLSPPKEGQLPGRGYMHSDLPVLMATGVSSGLNAVIVLALYVRAPESAALYPGRQAILLVPAIMLYWVSRLWMKAHRGEVHDDPILFALKDRQTIIIGACLALIFVLASSSLVGRIL